MSFNRPKFLRQALDSVLNQSYKNYEVIVSDNSTDDSVEKMIDEYYPAIKYIRYVPSLDVLSHHNLLIKNSTTEYVTYFHDDDIMLPSYAEKMIEMLDANMKLVAVAPNATLKREGLRFPKRFHSIKKLKFVSRWQDLHNGYFSFGGQGSPPFPGYMYRVCNIKGKGLYSNEGGRHSDYTFLDSLLDVGMIGWSELVLMEYRVHAGSSNKTEILADRRKLINYICRKYNLSKKDPSILVMRYRFLFSWNKVSGRSVSQVKKIIMKLSFFYLISNSGFRRELVIKLLNKVLNII
jgi:glycosyltransferase involved in cell wall biosynthesis